MLHIINNQLSLILIRYKLFIILIIYSIHNNVYCAFCANESQYIDEILKQSKNVPLFTEQEFFNHELTKRLHNLHNYVEANNLYYYCGLTIATITILGIGYFIFFNKATPSPDSGQAPIGQISEMMQDATLRGNPENYIPEVTPASESYGSLNIDNPLIDFFINDVVTRSEDQLLNENLMLFLLDNQEYIASFIGMPPIS